MVNLPLAAAVSHLETGPFQIGKRENEQLRRNERKRNFAGCRNIPK